MSREKQLSAYEAYRKWYAGELDADQFKVILQEEVLKNDDIPDPAVIVMDPPASSLIKKGQVGYIDGYTSTDPVKAIVIIPGDGIIEALPLKSIKAI